MSTLNNLFDLSLRVYVAGILVPATQVSITSSYQGLPTATIALPPYAELYGIGRWDRVPVQIFLKDTFAQSGQYVLMFDGEVSGFRYVSQAIMKAFVLDAVSVLNVLGVANILYLSSLEEVARYYEPGGPQATLSQQVALDYPLCLFMRGIAPARNNDIITYPSAFLENAYAFLQQSGSDPNVRPPINDSTLAGFFQRHCTKLNLMQRLVKLPYFDDPDMVWSQKTAPGADGKTKGFPLLAGLKAHAALEQLANIKKQAPTAGSVLELINFITYQMEYELTVPAAPTYHAGAAAEAGEGQAAAQAIAEKAVATGASGTIAAGNQGRLAASFLKPILYDAVPPKCNIIWRCFVSSLSTSEQVLAAPTRIRTKDLHGVINQLFGQNLSILSDYGMIDFYPTNHPEREDEKGNKNLLAEEILDTEEYKGPLVYQTEAPCWMSFINPSDLGEDMTREFKTRILKHMYMLEVYRHKNMNVSCAFNPYITPSFPAVVYDAQDTGFVFVGFVTAVEHSWSKDAASTQLELGFVRTLANENLDPLPNSLASLETVTKDAVKMSEVYTEAIGCIAESFGNLTSDAYLNSPAQNDPAWAYAQSARTLTTFEEYLGFMGLTAGGTKELGGEDVPMQLDGDYVAKRYDATIRDTLLTVSLREFASPIY